MPKTATKVSSLGTCKYCQTEVDKSKMTQHLKSCKSRAAKIKARNASDEPKVKLLHLLVEGTYLPMYWMHLEIPVDHTFYDLDDFLRATWVECCDHLSEFKVGNTSYLSRTQDMIWDIQIVGESESSENEQTVVEEDDEGPIDISQLSPLAVLDMVLESMADEFGTSLDKLPLEEIETKISGFLEQKFELEGKEPPPQLQPVINMLASSVQLGMLKRIVNMPREENMNAALGEVLKVGQKFSYTYDFGSSTDLSLKVLAEREGVETEDEEADSIMLMARNQAPVTPCRNCGKPAVGIFPGYGAPEYGAVCATCAKTNRQEYEDYLMPIVNSPRVGVCGYTGDDVGVDMDELDDDEEFDDEEEEDEE